MNPEPGEPLPLALQYIFTSLRCRDFAQALFTVVGAGEGSIVDLHSSDPAKSDTYEGLIPYFHTAVRLRDGSLVDAEGKRSLQQMERDFGNAPGSTVVKPAVCAAHDESSIVAKTRELLECLGWDDRLPERGASQTVSDLFSRASADFEFRTEDYPSPEAMLDSYVRDLSEAAPGLSRLREVIEFLDCNGDGQGTYWVHAKDVRFGAFVHVAGIWQGEFSIPVEGVSKTREISQPSLDDATDEALNWVYEQSQCVLENSPCGLNPCMPK